MSEDNEFRCEFCGCKFTRKKSQSPTFCQRSECKKARRKSFASYDDIPSHCHPRIGDFYYFGSIE